MERRVAVTGLGVISPVGQDVTTAWQAIKEGKNGIGRVTKFDATDFKATLAAEVKDFDPLPYMAKGELRKNDLFTQYALAAATQAVEDSGILGTVENERLGVYVGSGIGGISTMMTEHAKLLEGGYRKISPFFVPMMISNMAAGTIAIKFKACGATLPIVTACATSSNSIGEAYRAVKHGYADAVIAGGSEAAVNPLAYGGFINCMALSSATDPDAASLPFDARRGGFVMGEGGAVLILEEYEHACKRGAKIYAEMTGYGNTCDAHHITAPDPEATQSARALQIAMRESGIQEGNGVYINAHGTGTPLNDKTETAAIKKAFGEKEAMNVRVSSTKSMTGHMLGAAGAMEALVSVLALRDGIVPPTINYREPDPACDLNVTPNKAVKADIRFALSSSLGFGGHNACLAFKKA
ncbi:MAG: beta-ketoacyl-ACP synthase II [Clostridia bacterium]|jgi:3-oxoacyl-[acyl-carrier-protein] synthase II|nr:beta-ketoacyl-ACP synthase II [Clostridia bacterium]